MSVGACIACKRYISLYVIHVRLQVCAAALALDPSHADSHHQQGIVLHQLGQGHKAHAHVQLCMRLCIRMPGQATVEGHEEHAPNPNASNIIDPV